MPEAMTTTGPTRRSRQPAPGAPRANARRRGCEAAALPRRRCIAAGLLLAALAGGCSTLSTVQLALLAAKGSEAAAPLLAEHQSTGTVHLGAAVPKVVCIEFNPTAPAGDLLPALQAELRVHGVQTRVLAVAGPEADCRVWLRYVAVVLWDVPRGSSMHRPYLAELSLSLQDREGALMSESRYRTDQWIAPRKWAPTRQKVAPVVRSLVTGFTS